jgi:hypothetical protein
MLTTSEPPSDHGFAGFTMDDVYKFIRTNETRLKELNSNVLNWVIIDQHSLESSSCILAQREFDGEEMKYEDRFRAVRLPLTRAWSMYANMDIANMGFEDWIDEDVGLQEDGTYKWIGPWPGTNEGENKLDREIDAKREACLKIAKDLGHIE